MNPYLVPALTFFIGLWVGHRLNLDLARRREHNEAVAPYRDWLLKGGEGEEPSPLQRDAYEACLSHRRVRTFREALGRLHEAMKDAARCDSAGGPYCEKTPELEAAVEDMLKVTRPRR